MKARIILNGTDTNPYHALGLTQNPFPQILKYKYGAFNWVLNNLAAVPIKDTDDIRKRLEGSTDEFIELCCKLFKKGEMVQFEIEFPES